jgi:hypothetical protein
MTVRKPAPRKPRPAEPADSPRPALLLLAVQGQLYRLRRLARDLWRLEKLPAGPTYKVGAGGCTCPAAAFGWADRPCKHRAALVELGLLE